MSLYERIIELCFNRLIYYPSSEIYNPIAGFYDYGPVGLKIKKNIEQQWRKFFIQKHNFNEVESSIITQESVLKASGHVDEFTDPIVQCVKCKKKSRADKLIEEKLNSYSWNGNLDSLQSDIEKNKIACPYCKGNLSFPYKINLMFSTEVGYDGEKSYLRPETAQGIFTAFPRIFKTEGKLPLVVSQIGKSFRNEISPRQGLVRLREFTQMEIEYFFEPGTENSIEEFDEIKDVEFKIKLRGESTIKSMTAKEFLEIFNNKIMAFFLAKEWLFYKSMGLDEDKMAFRFLEQSETPHYSKGNIDLEVETSYGIIEIAGNAYRTDYDLSRHSEFSGKQINVTVEGRKFTPHVVEASMGLDRMFFCMLEHCYRKTENKEWEWFEFPKDIAPYRAAVFPLMKKDNLDKTAREVCDLLKEDFDIYYKESGSIGRRYARADEIGIPFAITIDYDTLKDNTVTVRYRNTGEQERVKISNLKEQLLA